MLAEKLDMDQDDAERWIVNLIRQAQLDATIDSAAVRGDTKSGAGGKRGPVLGVGTFEGAALASAWRALGGGDLGRGCF